MDESLGIPSIGTSEYALAIRYEVQFIGIDRVYSDILNQIMVGSRYYLSDEDNWFIVYLLGAAIISGIGSLKTLLNFFSARKPK